MPRLKNKDIGKTHSAGGRSYKYNGHLHEKLDYKTWLQLVKEAGEHNMNKASYTKYKLRIPLKPKNFKNN